MHHYSEPMLRAVAFAGLVLAAAATVPVSARCVDDGREPYAEPTFFGYACRDDCAPQKSGFGWAERHGIADPAPCRALESGAAEGCRAFVQEGLAPVEAGHAWALENEIAEPCLCDGAGPRFRAGCERYVNAG
jgi:hypothetical protein